MTYSQYPKVRRVRAQSYKEESTATTIAHFRDPTFYRVAMLGDYPEFDTFIENIELTISERMNAEAVELRTLRWLRHDITILSCPAHFEALAQLYAACNFLFMVKVDAKFGITLKDRFIAFPYHTSNVAVAGRASERRQ